jgi:hypothetical protein
MLEAVLCESEHKREFCVSRGGIILLAWLFVAAQRKELLFALAMRQQVKNKIIKEKTR